MPFRMQVNGQDVHPSGRPDQPYEYTTQEEAVAMLHLCYPDQCRVQRLENHQPPYEGCRVRVVEVQRTEVQ